MVKKIPFCSGKAKSYFLSPEMETQLQKENAKTPSIVSHPLGHRIALRLL